MMKGCEEILMGPPVLNPLLIRRNHLLSNVHMSFGGARVQRACHSTEALLCCIHILLCCPLKVSPVTLAYLPYLFVPVPRQQLAPARILVHSFYSSSSSSSSRLS